MGQEEAYFCVSFIYNTYDTYDKKKCGNSLFPNKASSEHKCTVQYLSQFV